MEDKKYEAGRVEISSAEYRDLVKEACEARHEASEQRSLRWKLESEIKTLKEELESANKRSEDLSRQLAQVLEARALAQMEISKYTNMAEGANEYGKFQF